MARESWCIPWTPVPTQGGFDSTPGIYFALVGENVIKIGKSMNPPKRVLTLETMHRAVPKLLAVFPANVSRYARNPREATKVYQDGHRVLSKTERDFHAKLAQYQIVTPGHDELFELSETVLAWINAIRTKHNGLDPWSPHSPDYKKPARAHRIAEYVEWPEETEKILLALGEDYCAAAKRLVRLKKTSKRGLLDLRAKLVAWLQEPNRKTSPFTEHEWRYLGIEHIRRALR